MNYIQRQDYRLGQLLLVTNKAYKERIINIKESHLIRNFEGSSNIIAIILGTNDFYLGQEIIESILISNQEIIKTGDYDESIQDIRNQIIELKDWDNK